MKYRVVVELQAERDLRQRYGQIAEGAPLNAIRWFNRVDKAIRSLSTQPERCPRAPENEEIVGVEIRHLLVGDYRVLYTIQEQSVHVLHIRHCARERARRVDLTRRPHEE